MGAGPRMGAGPGFAFLHQLSTGRWRDWTAEEKDVVCSLEVDIAFGLGSYPGAADRSKKLGSIKERAKEAVVALGCQQSF